ncbi:MAG: citrate lyase subunit alpha, partial [Fusobacteriaceae bacterium]
VNPRRGDLKEKFIAAGLKLIEMDDLVAAAKFITGEPKAIEFTDEVVAIVEYRDGSIIDVIKKIKK